MSSHPDADAFVRAILDDPAELTTRLAFADWLEETGTPSNVAWARFIRLKSDEHHFAPGTAEYEKCQWQLSKYATFIRARLTIAADRFVAAWKSWLQLLPLDRIRVRLSGFSPAPDTRTLLSGHLAAVYRIIPLVWDRLEDSLIITHPGEENLQAVDDLKNLLGPRRIVCVDADLNEVWQAIRGLYSLGAKSHADFIRLLSSDID